MSAVERLDSILHAYSVRHREVLLNGMHCCKYIQQRGMITLSLPKHKGTLISAVKRKQQHSVRTSYCL